MSNTPKTDAAIVLVAGIPIVDTHFARELERENALLREELVRFLEALGAATDRLAETEARAEAAEAALRELSNGNNFGGGKKFVHYFNVTEFASAALAELHAKLKPDTSELFARWWDTEGSGLPPKDGEDQETHTRRVAEIAWSNGAYMQALEEEATP